VKRFFTVTLLGLIVVSAVPPSALAFHCVAAAPTGHPVGPTALSLVEPRELPFGLVFSVEVISTGANVILRFVAEGRSIQVAI
jgi:hypothetical protein